MESPCFYDAFKVGVLFGSIEAITPLLGWGVGYFVVQYISQWDHWIIFALMLFLGCRMIKNSLSKDDPCANENALKEGSFFILILTALSTSIDAFAVGISLALASVNIGLAAFLIGMATCIMVTIGILIGKMAGQFLGKRAELFGGITLVFIGFWIFISHFIDHFLEVIKKAQIIVPFLSQSGENYIIPPIPPIPPPMPAPRSALSSLG